jgi:hypothetical protein
MLQSLVVRYTYWFYSNIIYRRAKVKDFKYYYHIINSICISHISNTSKLLTIEVSKETVASLCYVSITSSRFLLGSHHECTTSYLRYVLATDFFRHVQNSVTFLKSFKTILCPYQFALRFRCVVEVFGRFS